MIWYDLQDIALKILNEIDEVKKACKTSYHEEKPLNSCIKKLNRLIELIKDTVKEEQLSWKKVLRNLH